jgi:hypothetical protein
VCLLQDISGFTLQAICLRLFHSLLETEGKHYIYVYIKVYTEPTECHSLHIADTSLNNMMDTPTQVSRM